MSTMYKVNKIQPLLVAMGTGVSPFPTQRSRKQGSQNMTLKVPPASEGPGITGYHVASTSCMLGITQRLTMKHLINFLNNPIKWLLL